MMMIIIIILFMDPFPFLQFPLEKGVDVYHVQRNLNTYYCQGLEQSIQISVCIRD